VSSLPSTPVVTQSTNPDAREAVQQVHAALRECDSELVLFFCFRAEERRPVASNATPTLTDVAPAPV